MHSPVGFIAAAALVTLGGCASDVASRVGSAAATPLNDLGLRKADIPAVLAKAHDNPYLAPPEPSCTDIAAELHELDEALGPDFDAPAAKGKPSLMSKVSGLAEDQAVGAVQRTAEDLIPFRSWVRKLSGAERHSERVSACIMAGSVRRAFLKGMAASQHCGPQSVPEELKKT